MINERNYAKFTGKRNRKRLLLTDVTWDVLTRNFSQKQRDIMFLAFVRETFGETVDKSKWPKSYIKPYNLLKGWIFVNEN